ncbi:MAG: 16S rRNA (cytidine(1402)-2'-O)-methyltransferase [Akkermansiaceae bacterium]
MISFVPTPIGNREDITLRALETLKDADFIACEDTRHSKRLLLHHGIDRPLISLHDHNEAQRIPELIDKVSAGHNIAVISDAGTPLVSDPGYRLMQACLENGIDYTVLPGPSAVITALAGSGMPCHAFQFDGFLPVKKGKRKKLLLQGLLSAKTVMYFESPHRLLSTLKILSEIAPAAAVCVARELSKKFETYHRGSALEVYDEFSNKQAKGEIVLLINGTSAEIKED